MSKTIRIKGGLVKFSGDCVVCAQPASETYNIAKVFTYGSRSINVTLPLPMCPEHAALAKTKSRAEKKVEQAGFVGGSLIGLLVTIGLIVYWLSTHQGMIIYNLFIAVFVGFGFFLIVWVATKFWLAPTFAAPGSKAVRNSVTLEKLWPAQDILEIKIENDWIAEQVIRENTANLAD